MRSRIWVLVLVTAILLALSGCNLDSNDNNEEEDIDNGATATVSSSTRPTVTITSPASGSEVVVGSQVNVLVNARHPQGVTSVQLVVNGTNRQTAAAPEEDLNTNRDFLLNFVPSQSEAGTATVSVIAYSGSVSSDPATITLNIRATQSQVTATAGQTTNIPPVDPNDPTCRMQVQTNLNFRTGPSTDFSVIRVLAPGELLPVIGRLGDNSWYQASSGTSIGWASGNDQFVTLYGSQCVNVPVVAAPATPTPRVSATPTPTRTFTPTATSFTATPSITSTPSLPNLSAPTISPGNNTTITIPSGESEVTQTFGVTIRNSGGPVATQFSNSIRIGISGTEQDLGVVGALGSNQSISLSATLTFTSPGTYIVVVEVDSDDEITEEVETDNLAQVQVIVVDE
jgi:hypothetical protein